MKKFLNPNVASALASVHAGGVIAYPTEAVWGLGCDPWDEFAVQRVLRLKQRSVDKGLILIGSEMSHFAPLIDELPSDQKKQIEESWPGPVTWLVPHKNRLPKFITGAHDKVAIRVTAHPIAAALCDKFGGPLVSTSANPQGSMPARHLYRVRNYFGLAVTYATGQVDLNASPSTIRDAQTGAIIRA